MSRPAVSFLAWTAIPGRADDIAAALGGEAHAVVAARLRGRRATPLRYAVSAAATVLYLLRRRPRSVIATNPPVFPGLLALAYGAVARVPVVIDAHPGSFGAQGDRVAARLVAISRWMVRRAAASLVTSTEWVETVAAWGGRGLILHEPPGPWTLRPPAATSPGGRRRVLVAWTFGGDEPLDVVLDAAGAVVDLDVDVIVTGDVRRAPPGALDHAPTNVSFPGFLPLDRYRDLVYNADVVIVLSTEPTSVMRAAYEAVYAGRPIVVSDWPGLREVFPYAVHVANDAASLAAGIRDALARHGDLAVAAAVARERQIERWDTQLANLRAALGMGDRPAS